MTSPAKAVRSRSRSGSRSPRLIRTHSKVRVVGDLLVDTREDRTPPATPKNGDAPASPRSGSPRFSNPIAATKRVFALSPRKIVRRAPKQEQSILSKYLSQSLPAKVSGLLSIVVVVVAIALFFGESDGPKLVKRDASLRPGDQLSGGQYITSCTSYFATGCKPKYLELGHDGSLGVYAGYGPHAMKAKLWSANTESNSYASYELLYSPGKVTLHKDGKMKWSMPLQSLPKNMQPWPFGPMVGEK